jgi:hypothetical protein
MNFVPTDEIPNKATAGLTAILKMRFKNFFPAIAGQLEQVLM